MSYYPEHLPAKAGAHAFVPGTSSPINNQPMYAPGVPTPIIAGGDLGAYFATVPGTMRYAKMPLRQRVMPQLGDIPSLADLASQAETALSGSMDVNALVGPIVQQLEPTMDRVFQRYMPRVESSVSRAVSAGIRAGVAAELPKIERKVDTKIASVEHNIRRKIEPLKNYGIALGLAQGAILLGVGALLYKAGNKKG